MPAEPTPGTSSFQATFGSMTDSQLKQTISQLSTAASQTAYANFRSPIPQSTPFTPLFEARQWSATPNPKPPRQRNRAPRTNTATPVQQAQPVQAQVQPQQQVTVAPPAPAPVNRYNSLNRAPLPTTPQALRTTYASRLRTGTTLLMQPILASSNAASSGRTGTRRGGVINYADPGSGDELDAGAIDSDDSDFIASGGTRTAIRQSRTGRPGVGASYLSYSLQSHQGTPVPQGKHELDQSYLGLIPPSRFITSKRAEPTKHEYYPLDALETQAQKSAALVPIRVEFETDTHRIRDCFVWDLNDSLVKPETFARIFCADLDLPANTWVETVANQIRAQLEDQEGLASMDLGSTMDGYAAVEEDSDGIAAMGGGDGDWQVPECRVILSIDVQIATYHLMDHIEWDLLSPLTPEAFAKGLCADIGLSGEAIPLIAHAIHEEILKHKKDAVEWGVIGGDVAVPAAPAQIASIRSIADGMEDTGSAGGTRAGTRAGSVAAGATPVPTTAPVQSDRAKERAATLIAPMKDKLGLGNWGRAPRDGLGRGPRALKSVWRDWSEAEEFATRFEVLTAEEVERREIERERASRRLRRETSKFQHNTTRRRWR